MRRSLFTVILAMAATFFVPALAAAQASTTLTVTSVVTNPEPYGVLPITLNVSSGSGIPTGAIGYTIDGGPVNGGGPVDQFGNDTIDVVPMNVGAHNLVFTFNGDSGWANSTVAQPVTVVANTLNLTIGVTPTTLSYGDTISVGISVTGGSHLGTLRLYSDGTELQNAAPFSQDSYTFGAAMPPGGSHQVTVRFDSSDGNTNPSISNAVPITVATINPAMSVFGSSNPAQVNSALNITAQMRAPQSGSEVLPTGTVDFSEGPTDYGTIALNTVFGYATLNLSTLPAGSHVITASYSGDGNYSAFSTSYTQVITPVTISTTATLSTDASTYVYNQVVQATVHVDTGGYGVPSGTVTINDVLTPGGASAPVGTGTLDNSGNVVVPVTGLVAGGHTLTAIYTPASNTTE